MFLFNLLKRNKILAFAIGLLFVVILSYGVFPLTSNLFKKDPSLALTAGNALPNSISPLGVGLNGITDWSSELPFIDIFKQSRDWITQCGEGSPENCPWGTQENDRLDLDENGWVKSLPDKGDTRVKFRYVETPIFMGNHPLIPGRYIVLYEGEGTLDYFGASKNESLSQPGREVIDVSEGTEAVFLRLMATNPSNYLRNIRVIREAHESLYRSGEIFNPDFLDNIKPFSTLRFMDWMGTNNSQQKEWSNRPQPSDRSWALNGAPIEVMVALANKLKADAWFNMPHMATDDYVSNFAQLVKKTLDPNLNVYVEYSNEVWNWQFGQAQYANEQGRARWGDKGDAFMQWNGMKASQFTAIWKNAFGSQSNRVKGVLGVQTGYRGLEEGLLNCPLWVAEGHEPCYKNADVLAMTGYISGALGKFENGAVVESWLNDADGGFSKALQQLRSSNLLNDDFKDGLPDIKSNVQYFHKIAAAKNLELVAYEGGSHIVGSGGLENNEKLTNFYIALNRRPEMYDIYTDLLTIWKENGGTLFNHFVDISMPSKWGSWGAVEYVTQENSPKYKALIDFINKNPCWWDKCTIN